MINVANNNNIQNVGKNMVSPVKNMLITSFHHLY